MSYLVQVMFSSPDRPDITISDIIGSDDWSYANYWDDMCDCVSSLIAFSERILSQLFPNGHNYSLSNVQRTYLEDDEE